MLDRKRREYSSQQGIFSLRDRFSKIMVGSLTPYNLYKVEVSDAANKVSATQASTEIEFGCEMTTDVSKLATDQFTWQRQLAYLNEASVKQLSTMVTGMEIFQSQNNTSSLCSVCIEAKMSLQHHQDARLDSSQSQLRLHSDVGGGGRTYIIFRRYHYFIFFVCKATGHVRVRFLKKKSDTLSAF